MKSEDTEALERYRGASYSTGSYSSVNVHNMTADCDRAYHVLEGHCLSLCNDTQQCSSVLANQTH